MMNTNKGGRGGIIVNLSSLTGNMLQQSTQLDEPTKHFIIGLTQSLRVSQQSMLASPKSYYCFTCINTFSLTRRLIKMIISCCATD